MYTGLCDHCTELWVDKQAKDVWNEQRIGWGHLEKAHPSQSFELVMIRPLLIFLDLRNYLTAKHLADGLECLPSMAKALSNTQY